MQGAIPNVPSDIPVIMGSKKKRKKVDSTPDSERKKKQQKKKAKDKAKEDDIGDGFEEDVDLGDLIDETAPVDEEAASGKPGKKKKEKAAPAEEAAEEEEPERGDFGEHEVDEKAENARMKELMETFSVEEIRRFEAFRRSSLSRAMIKKVMQSVVPNMQVSQLMTIAMGGIAKLFVGELVEKGREVMLEAGETGPLRPRHLREAYRRLQNASLIPSRTASSRLFSR
eukprot:tig00001532_g9275.t1